VSDADLERLVQAAAAEAFPDDAGVRWRVLACRERRGFRCVEAEPEPATVGYPRFRFVFDERDTDHGCYALDGARWRLLYTTPGTASAWTELRFDLDW
jgi:hypothetical protein